MFLYNNDLLSTVTTDDVVYTFTYDDWGQTKSVSVDNQKLVEYNYGKNEYRSRVNSIEQLNDKDTNTKYSLNYFYDEYGKVTQIVKTTLTNSSDKIVYNYYYDNLGNLIAIADSNTGRTIRYSDDGDVTIEATGKNDVIYKSYYNEDGEFSETIDGGTYTTKNYDSSYNASTGDTTQKEAVVSTKNSTTKTLGITTVTDWFGRNKTVTVSTNDPTTTTTASDVSIVSGNVYKSYDSNKTTNLIATNRNTISFNGVNSSLNFVYTYDENGRIVSRRNAGSLATDLVEYNTYAYDEAGQIIRENKSTQKTWVYEYDANGNITKRKTYNYTAASATPTTLVSTDTFTYATGTWEDRLVSYNGQSIVYDDIGNPTTYLGATLNWRGRELANYTKGTTSIDYSYDVDGMRYQKVVKTNGSQTAKYNYVYSDGQLILLSYTTGGTTQNAKFIYDSAGEVRGFVVNGTTQYLYVKNPQGDIVAIVNEYGAPVVRYIYDAWGNTTILANSGYENLVNLSPFAYRGYCYDNDIKMYYLQSRYYDPQICRFINADSSEYLGATGTVLSCNLFAYCENDPVNCVDATGTWAKEVHYNDTKTWAESVGYNSIESKTIAKADQSMDNITNHAMFIWNQHIHFNTNINGGIDSRMVYAMTMLTLACVIWDDSYSTYLNEIREAEKKYSGYNLRKKKKELLINLNNNKGYCIKMVGQGLHAIQDIEGHGQTEPTIEVFGITLTQHIVSSGGKKKHKSDNTWYSWKNNQKTHLYFDYTRERYYNTKADSLFYLRSFFDFRNELYKQKYKNYFSKKEYQFNG